MSKSIKLSRRSFLLASSAAAAVNTLNSSAWALSTLQNLPQHDAVLPNRDGLLKFNPDGSVRPFAGNTVICHLPAQSVMRDRAVELHDALAGSSFRPKLGLLPPDSFHMTVFSGANDQDRKVTGWPSDVPLTASIEECNRIVGDRMNRFHVGCEMPLRMILNQPRTIAYDRACTLRMMPADDTENRKIRALRDRLGEVYHFRSKDHDRYEFHITLAYQMKPFSTEEQALYTSILRTHIPRIAASVPVLELGLPEFCTFKDMYRFDIQKLLST
ncbi:DUF1868 domain-containing protein [Granulicella arctica]|uniref:DUF1868 domain-containing protein n=1 Tax=Granulicella arctica TaxID=940613 RepID=A0A7Y9PDY8_9BACT|nr:DUF1868 domain-containing protein [Granulicella arctica]NYF78166.1 hypothetical protein [Granulicella arctica]